MTTTYQNFSTVDILSVSDACSHVPFTSYDVEVLAVPFP